MSRAGRRGRQARGGVPVAGQGLGAGQGLSEDQVRARWDAQGGRCMICDEPMQEVERDHDHDLARRHGHDPSTGCPRCFRALLCRPCNSMLGFARDSALILRAAARYLDAWAVQQGRARAPQGDAAAFDVERVR